LVVGARGFEPLTSSASRKCASASTSGSSSATTPEAADRDAATRARLVAQLTELIDGTDKLPTTKRAELRGVISTKPGLNRYLRVTPSGLLRIDKAAVKAETSLDGKYLLRCSDPHLPAEDIALGYKQLLEVERGWRDMKQVIDLRPVYQRLEERIRAHVVLCWLALLLVRIVENTTGATWQTLTAELNRLHVITLTGPDGTFRQRTELTKPQRDTEGSYAYEETIEHDGAIMIDMKARMADPAHTELQALITRHSADYPSYFPVVRKGLQDTPRTMRWGKCTWSAHDGVFKHNLILVEDAYDQGEPKSLLPLDYPEGRRAREMAAKTSALVTELLRVLEAKSALDADEVRQLTATAERQVKGLTREFFRMDDIDTVV
jgi:hypothetical protein